MTDIAENDETTALSSQTRSRKKSSKKKKKKKKKRNDDTQVLPITAGSGSLSMSDVKDSSCKVNRNGSTNSRNTVRTEPNNGDGKKKLRPWPNEIRPMDVGIVVSVILIAIAVFLGLNYRSIFGTGVVIPREDRLYKVLREASESLPESYESLTDTTERNTPQERAADWVLNKDPSQISNSNDKWLTTRYALATLFYSTGGETLWEKNTNWLEHENACKWHGVNCIGNIKMEERLVLVEQFESLDLKSNGLNGNISPEIGLLRDVRLVFLNDNDLVGNIPSELGQMKALETIHLQANKLTGDMPSSLMELTYSPGVLADLWNDCGDSGLITCNDCLAFWCF
mmetsp:Transcript_32184/g.47345  ORF Transcript_32184/g.47345 Transcript_32184/m.47345 type:complete len:341 (-) Transcript_32184:484-1506(-)|eukprot:CAMPEP_0195522014 /NCGR_PEP_ID=MMETSP0794_2-20130614/19880_1 /TAXON_ID=515487 /ORGANISM="Stephanopyxis turris, Strain CCMP 815" /LENGTH=340 /DNA_ID=CAMNT_0040651689 /DNA_START=36 /DNA_END=1058 /DNA_ORIENTATION=-